MDGINDLFFQHLVYFLKYSIYHFRIIISLLLSKRECIKFQWNLMFYLPTPINFQIFIALGKYILIFYKKFPGGFLLFRQETLSNIDHLRALDISNVHPFIFTNSRAFFYPLFLYVGIMPIKQFLQGYKVWGNSITS